MNLKRIWLLLAPTLVLLAMALTQSCDSGLLGQSTVCGQSINPFEFVPLISCSPPTPTPGPPGPGITSVSLCPAASSSASPTPCPSFTATSVAVGATVAFESIASFSNGTTEDVTDAGTTFWSNSNPSVLAPAPSPSPSPGEYSAVCPGSSVVVASLNSGLKSQQVSVGVTGTGPSGCPTTPASAPTSGAQVIAQQAAAMSLPTLQWSFNAQASIGPTIVAAPAGTIYFTSTDGVLHALGTSGQELWSASVGGPPLLLDQNQNLYAVGPQGSVEALDANGLTLWQLGAGAGVAALALGPHGVLYAAGPGGLISFTQDGVVNWSIPGAPASALAVSSSGEVVMGVAGGALVAVAPNGQQTWSMTPAGGFAGALAADSNGNLYAGSAAGVVYALGANGRIAWQFQASGPIVAGPMIGPGGTIEFVADGLYALDQSGQLAWHTVVAASGAGSATLAPFNSSQSLVGESGDVALIVQSNGAASAALKVNGAINALFASAGGQIYLGSQNGYLYSIK